MAPSHFATRLFVSAWRVARRRRHRRRRRDLLHRRLPHRLCAMPLRRRSRRYQASRRSSAVSRGRSITFRSSTPGSSFGGSRTSSTTTTMDVSNGTSSGRNAPRSIRSRKAKSCSALTGRTPVDATHHVMEGREEHTLSWGGLPRVELSSAFDDLELTVEGEVVPPAQPARDATPGGCSARVEKLAGLIKSADFDPIPYPMPANVELRRPRQINDRTSSLRTRRRS